MPKNRTISLKPRFFWGAFSWWLINGPSDEPYPPASVGGGGGGHCFSTFCPPQRAALSEPKAGLKSGGKLPLLRIRSHLSVLEGLSTAICSVSVCVLCRCFWHRGALRHNTGTTKGHGWWMRQRAFAKPQRTRITRGGRLVGRCPFWYGCAVKRGGRGWGVA